ncbi:Polymerase beta nucleotidyltransferase domain-containing protein [Candidatus Magnetomoraceae bacterium gMMP-1]
MDKKEVIKKAVAYSNIVKKYFSVKFVVLFGSYVNNRAREDSDIDLAVIVNKIDKDYLESAAKLFQLRRNIDIMIEPILFEAGNDPSGFLDQILEEGEIVYSSQTVNENLQECN